MKKKIIISEQIESVGDKFTHESLPTLINYLQDKNAEFVNRGYSKIELRFDWDGYDSPFELVFYGERTETEAEFKKRKLLEETKKEVARKNQEKEKENLIKRAKELGLKVIEDK